MTHFVRTAEDAHVYVRLDYDDPEDYDEQLSMFSHWVTVIHGERIGFGPSLNELAKLAERDGYSHLGMFGDDVVPKTQAWDVAWVEALGGRMGVAYGNDGLRDLHSPDLPTHYVVDTEVYRRLGYLSPPGIRHLFLDNVARDIGRYLDNFVFVNVDIQHYHPWAVGEHVHDQTYEEGGRNRRIRDADRKTYIRWAGSRDWKRALRG